MRRMGKAWVLVATLVFLFPARALAAEYVSKRFATAGLGDGGELDFGIVVKKDGAGDYPSVRTGGNSPSSTITVTAGDAAAVIATEAVNKICLEAVATGYGCAGTQAGGFCNDGPGGSVPGDGNIDCCDAAEGADVEQTIECQTRTGRGPLGGFHIAHAPGSDRFVVTPVIGSNLKAVNSSNRSGILVGTDLLSMFCLRLDRGLVDGTVNFAVRHFHGDANGVVTTPFSVNTTGLSDIAIHNAIASGLSAAVPNLELSVMDSPGEKCVFDDDFNGPLVSIWNLPGSGVLELRADGLAGQNIVAESSGTSGQAQIPTLSEWGLILLVAALSISAIWMLRRRRQIGSAA